MDDLQKILCKEMMNWGMVNSVVKDKLDEEVKYGDEILKAAPV